MGRARAIGTWIGLILFGLLMGGGLVELGVRRLHLIQDRFWELDPVLGVRHIAGKTGWWTQEAHEFFVPIQINAAGLRDVDHTYAKPSGTTRILMLGDSFVEALQVPLEQTLGRRLAARLGPTVEPISAGVSGYGTAGELLFLQQEGWRYDPDLVVLAFYPGNDVKNNSSTLEDVLLPVYDADGRLARVREPDSPDASMLRDRKGWRDRLYAYRLARQLLMQHRELAKPLHRFGFLSADGPRTAPERGGVPIDYWVFATEPDEEWLTAWVHTEALLGEAKATVRAHGRQFVIIVIPSRYQIYPAWWDETMTGHPAMRQHQWDVEQPTHRVLAWCKANDVPCLDLAPAFRGAAAGSVPLYFHSDGHWTAAGHELAALKFSEFLHEHGLVRTQSE